MLYHGVFASYVSTGRSSWSDLLIGLAALVLITVIVGYKRHRDGTSDPGPRVEHATRAQLEQAIALTFRRDHVGIARGDVALLTDSFAPGEWPSRAGLAQRVRRDDGVSGARIRTLLTDRRVLLLGASPTRRAPGQKTIDYALKRVATISALADNRYTVSLSDGHSVELHLYGSAQPMLRRAGTAFYDALKAARPT